MPDLILPARVSRRSFLRTTSVAVAGASLLDPLARALAQEKGSLQPYVHRAYNGWITDLATEPDSRAAWPSMRLDARLLMDYRETFDLMRRLGMNEIVIWGLYVSNNWPLNIVSAVPIPDRRGLLVEQLITLAHERGIKVLSGLGVYSWGFAKIIRANRKLMGTNMNAMCASQPESHAWMQRVVDFVFARFPIDGVSMQSADQGRCSCAQCRRLSDAEYHADLNIRTAEYIRSKYPGKIIGMSNWGLPFKREKDKEALVRMSRALDYLIDHDNSAQSARGGYRRELIGGLACAFGTSGGPVVEPPQHWERNRWFLPTGRRVHQHLQKLAEDGGRACEFFFHILANPSSELTWHIAARTLANPALPLDKILAAVIEELYQPKDAAARDALAQWMLDMEEAYFRYLPGELCGTISLEPLVGSKPGPAVYIRDRLRLEQRNTYAADFRRLAEAFEKLRPSLAAQDRANRVAACLSFVRLFA